MSFLLQVLLECGGGQNPGPGLRKLMSSLAERGIEETSVLLLMKEAEDSRASTAGVLHQCDSVGNVCFSLTHARIHTRTHTHTE